MPRFVILEHDHPVLHWDLMLQAGETLRTWRLESAPAPQQRISATLLADHRLIYLDYEGEVSGGRGRVRRWDSGTLEWITEEVERVAVELFGVRVSGRAYLCKEGSGAWRFELTSGGQSVDPVAARCDAPTELPLHRS
jgi:hypothetical protein